MAILHNRVSQAELKQRLFEENFHRITVSFYRYLPIENPVVFRDELYKNLNSLRVFGRIYIAQEGINAQVSIPETYFSHFKEYLKSVPGLEALRINTAVDDDGKSFWVLKIKVRKKIVADGIEDPSFYMKKGGKYVSAVEFNTLTDDPDTILIDMRNHYEYEVGHFENANEIPSDTFREQLPMAADLLKEQKEKNIIMYCTGGIRCEKASAYMLHHGFKNVFHLEGGIIHYANTVKKNNLPNKFIGKNFVFDERLGERISEHIIAKCHQCGKPADNHINCRNEGCHLLFIQCEKCKAQYNGCCSKECREIILLPEEDQKQIRKGIEKGQMIFHKSQLRSLPRTNRYKKDAS